MIIGERNYFSNPTVRVPPWNSYGDDPTVDFSLTLSPNANANAGEELELPVDAYTCDHFRMYEFKVRKCTRGKCRDWTQCPYAHSCEKARRRDPRKFYYTASACPDFRKGICKRGDGCEFSHGVFECYLHPARYRTQPCKDGRNCRRRVCFFAHSPEEFRVLSPTGVGYMDSLNLSPRGVCFDNYRLQAESPPISLVENSASRCLGSNSVGEMVISLRQLHFNKVKSMPISWARQMGSSRFGSPRSPITRSGFCGLPITPTQSVAQPDYIDVCDEFGLEEQVMERIESGRELRAKMFERLSKENPLGWIEPSPLN